MAPGAPLEILHHAFDEGSRWGRKKEEKFSEGGEGYEKWGRRL